jgi:NADPH:quinone reductase-like Zn-dependent oxidoreductase
MSATVYFEEYGSPKVLRHREETLPGPGSGEVRIANRAVSVNPADWKIVAGYMREFRPSQFPAVPGLESAGVVVEAGPGVEGFGAGDEVIWYGFANGYRSEANVAADQLIAKPANIDFDQAASLPVAAGTAYSALRQIEVGPGDTVLIHGAAGGVGIAAVQIARDLGARVIGTASPANHDYLISIGAEPVAYGAGLADAVGSLGEVTAVFDTHGGADSVAATRALLPDLTRAVTAVSDQHSADAGIAPVTSTDDRLRAVVALAERGVIRFPIAERLPLLEAAKAFEISYGGHVRGKLILVP